MMETKYWKINEDGVLYVWVSDFLLELKQEDNDWVGDIKFRFQSEECDTVAPVILSFEFNDVDNKVAMLMLVHRLCNHIGHKSYDQSRYDNILEETRNLQSV